MNGTAEASLLNSSAAAGLEFLNNTAEHINSGLSLGWGDLLVGPYNQTESEEWQREYVRQYELRHRNDPEVKYAVVIFYLIMVCVSTAVSLDRYCLHCWIILPLT